VKKYAWLCTLLPLLSVGCSDFSRIDFQPKTTPPEPMSLRSERIELTEGVAVAVKAVPLDTGDDMMDEDTRVELSSSAPTILGVEQGAPDGYFDSNDDQPPQNWNFVFFGAGPGKTTLRVIIDGVTEGEIPVEVTPQP
jgi:hypothetical protein